jgi:hypothetical protein
VARKLGLIKASLRALPSGLAAAGGSKLTVSLGGRTSVDKFLKVTYFLVPMLCISLQVLTKDEPPLFPALFPALSPQVQTLVKQELLNCIREESVRSIQLKVRKTYGNERCGSSP